MTVSGAQDQVHSAQNVQIESTLKIDFWVEVITVHWV